ncbi:hypothetical protein TCAL_03628 [Tigriopus californicus]|uniref:Hexosyltransferase n=1 Tax=Tigriopus californicus TaxID=6832 RepID=A0A553NDM9_TIGCA|nr:beta-1,3-galactosyltransferase brn-like [Tigriopus californicus]TRY63459.1 hypothetical protein TCAL_03628 [Tigriopus californicus]|eukprot:TCALIF_03628-PA protein Name:"Similar to brn Beta-1,3-galactosyltransferase brn (Drosophila melanogaster)" AED:0.04 eAED:0.04 QI:0/-1/0/1/-1/1/1/0/377
MMLRQVHRFVTRLKLKHVVPAAIVLFFLCDIVGLFHYLRAKDYETSFQWPLEGNILELATQMRRGETPTLKPINPHDYMLVKHSKGKCIQEDGVHYANLRLIYLVKSAVDHFEHREVIRKTWGFERRFSDVEIRTVFLLGQRPEQLHLKDRVMEEYKKHKDILQGDFYDSYFNNTLKTMMGMRWAMEQCPTSRFYFFVDDDYYVSTRNTLAFLRNPLNYPHYLEDPVVSFDDETFQVRKLQQIVNFDIPTDAKLLAGFVFRSRPLRQKWSKWYVDVEEYPFHLWPPYVTAGAYIMSRTALSDMYFGSYFVKRFRFDDIYLGILAKKLELELTHCDEFHFHRKPYTVRGYRHVVASHGFSDPQEMSRVWNQQKESGNA